MDEWSRFIQEINPTIRFLFDKHNKRVSKNKLKIAKEMVLGPLFNYQRKNVDFTSYFWPELLTGELASPFKKWENLEDSIS